MKIVIDGQDAVYGRLCSYAAKQALEGNEVVVVNSEKVVISGNKENAIKKYSELRAKGGHSMKGPKYSKLTSRMLRRGIRGMLPDHREGIGKQAFKRIMCYDGVPEEFKKVKKTEVKKIKSDKHIELKELSKKI